MQIGAIYMDWGISLGNVLTFFGMVVAFLTAHMRGIERIKGMEVKLDLIFDWWLKRKKGDD